MSILVKLFAGLRVGRFKAERLDIPEGTTILELLELLKIELLEVSIIRVNGNDISDEHRLLDKDEVTIFPLIYGG